MWPSCGTPQWPAPHPRPVNPGLPATQACLAHLSGASPALLCTLAEVLATREAFHLAWSLPGAEGWEWGVVQSVAWGK